MPPERPLEPPTSAPAAGTRDGPPAPRLLLVVACGLLALGGALYFRVAGDLTAAAARALFILLFAATLWMTEAVPAYAVGILVIGLQIALLGRPEGAFARTPRDWEHFASVLGHPLVWLFFGGFVMAAGMRRTGLDRQLARALLARLGDRPSTILLGVMALTFGFSMFVSNTATAAMMLALLAPLLHSIDADDPFGRALLLGVAVGANVGGMGTLIGSPPNAIAVGALAERGLEVSFLEWTALGLPPALCLGLGGWLLLLRLYPPRRGTLAVVDVLERSEEQAGVPAPAWHRPVVAVTLLLTVGLWLSTGWHGIPTAAVSFLPIVLLTMTGVLGAAEIRTLNYDVLFLLAGGLALGQMVTDTGLSAWIVDRLPLAGLGLLGVATTMAYVTALLSNVMSNTAAANILVPLGVTMATAAPAQVALPIALAASAAMCLPVATPPNAIVSAAGRLDARDFLRVGLLLAAVAPVLAVLWTRFVLGALPVLP